MRFGKPQATLAHQQNKLAAMIVTIILLIPMLIITNSNDIIDTEQHRCDLFSLFRPWRAELHLIKPWKQRQQYNCLCFVVFPLSGNPFFVKQSCIKRDILSLETSPENIVVSTPDFTPDLRGRIQVVRIPASRSSGASPSAPAKRVLSPTGTWSFSCQQF